MSDDAEGTTQTAEPAQGGLIAAAQQAAQSKAAQAPDPEPGAPPPIQRPDYLPEQFWDSTKGEIRHESLVKSWKEAVSARDKANAKLDVGTDPAPAEADGYINDEMFGEDGHLTLPPELSAWGKITKDDPMLNAFKAAAHKAGVGEKAFKGLLQNTLELMNPLLPQPVDLDAEITKLDAGEDGRGRRIVDGVTRWLTGLQSSGEFSESEVAYLDATFGQDAFGLRILQKFMNNQTSDPIPVGPSVVAESVSQHEWEQMLANPLYDEMTPAGESYRARVRAIGERLFR